MTKEKIMAMVKYVLGQDVDVQYKGNGMYELSNVLGQVRFTVAIPTLEDGEIVIGPRKLRDSYLGVLSKEIKKDQELQPQEVAVIARLVGNNVGKLEAYAIPAYNNWKAVKNFTLVPSADHPDKGFYVKLSEATMLELYRGLQLDKRRMQKPGFSGFSAASGCTVGMVWRHSPVSYTVMPEHFQYMVKFNRPIEPGLKSKYLDFACTPNDTKAVISVGLNLGTQFDDLGRPKGEPKLHASWSTANIPFRKTINQKRANKAMSQAMHLPYGQEPIVKVEDAPIIPGRNLLTYRNPDLPADTYVLSKTAASKLIAYADYERTIVIPHNCQFESMVDSKMANEDELNAAVALGVERNTVNKGDALIRFWRQKMGSAKEQDLKAAMLAEKEEVIVHSTASFTPTSIESGEAVVNGKQCTLIVIKGKTMHTCKVGSKLIDRFGNKGTVARILPDDQMPYIDLNDEKLTIDVMCNPPIYKKKIAMAYKAEEQLSLMYDEVELPEDADLETFLDLMREDAEGKRISVPLTMPDGSTVSSFRVGYHFMHHLAHDPREKLSMKGCKLTMVDRRILSKFGLNTKPDLSKINNHLEKVGLKATLHEDNTVTIDKLPTRITNVKPITRKLDRADIGMPISMIDPEKLRGTVADQDLMEVPGIVETDVGPLYTIPGWFHTSQEPSGFMVISQQLIALNAVVAEQDSINYLRYLLSQEEKAGAPDWKLDAIRRKISLGFKKLSSKVAWYNALVSQYIVDKIKEQTAMRLPGAHGVVVYNNDLPEDTVGVPRVVFRGLKRYFGKHSDTHMVLRRHPIHRIYNNVVVKVVPVEGYAFQVHENTMRLMDGDADGDLVEVVLIKRKDADRLFRKYNPISLWKGYQDISYKKKAERAPLTSDLGVAQADLKMFTALSGGIAIRMMRVADQLGWGHKLADQLYHFAAQTALNFKHISHGKSLLEQLSNSVYRSQLSNPGMAKQMVEQLIPFLDEKDKIRMSYLLYKAANQEPVDAIDINTNKTSLTDIQHVVSAWSTQSALSKEELEERFNGTVVSEESFLPSTSALAS